MTKGTMNTANYWSLSPKEQAQIQRKTQTLPQPGGKKHLYRISGDLLYYDRDSYLEGALWYRKDIEVLIRGDTSAEAIEYILEHHWCFARHSFVVHEDARDFLFARRVLAGGGL